MYQHIILAVDGSDHSIRATEEAIKLVKGTTTMVELVHVSDISKSKDEVLHTSGQEALEVKRRKKLLPIEERLDAEKVEYRLEVLRGEPGPTIVDYANKSQADLVIVGSRGLNSLQEMMLGSVSHKIVKRINCPVLLVK